MKFPPILHRPALFCLFGLIVTAVIGGAISWVGFKEWLRSWQELIGGISAAGVTFAAVWFTAKETRKIFQDQIANEVRKQKHAREQEIHRALSVIHHALEEDISELRGLETLLRRALKHDPESQQLWHYRRALNVWKNPNQTRINNLIDTIGDVEGQVCRMLLAYSNKGGHIIRSFDELLKMPMNSNPENGFTASISEYDLKLIRIQRYFARACQFIVEEYMRNTGIGHVSPWRTVTLTDQQDEILDLERQPVDIDRPYRPLWPE